MILEKFEDLPLLILPLPYLLNLAILELLQMCIDHFSEDGNAGTAVKLSNSSCIMFFYFWILALSKNRHV